MTTQSRDISGRWMNAIGGSFLVLLVLVCILAHFAHRSEALAGARDIPAGVRDIAQPEKVLQPSRLVVVPRPVPPPVALPKHALEPAANRAFILRDEARDDRTAPRPIEADWLRNDSVPNLNPDGGTSPTIAPRNKKKATPGTDVPVRRYFRQNGTPVRPHTRALPGRGRR